VLEVDIPGFGIVKLEHLVSAFSGTLSCDGTLLPGLAEQLNAVVQILQIHIVTADTFGKAQDEFKNVHCTVHILSGSDLDLQKEEYVLRLGAARWWPWAMATTIVGCSRPPGSASRSREERVVRRMPSWQPTSMLEAPGRSRPYAAQSG